MNKTDFDWSDLAFGSKKALPASHAIFVAAPRELSRKRFTELVKTYLPEGNIVLGLAKEDYVLGFENQPQFPMLKPEAIQTVIDKVNTSASKHKIYTLRYFQRETVYILGALRFKKVLFVNGSWKYTFHTRDIYYTLANKGQAYELISPFASEHEAREAEKTYTKATLKQLSLPSKKGAVFDEKAMLEHAGNISFLSFDHSFQTGVALGKKLGGTYTLLLTAFNKVVPYQTYAMHHGSNREIHFSPPNDLNHYDTIHAEMATLVAANKQNIDLKGTSLFINLMPCPMCARTLSESEIAEFIYSVDRSDGYAAKILVAARKTVRRVVI